METTLVFGGRNCPQHIDRAVEQAAGIVAQIEHQRLHSLLLQIVERLRQFFRGRFVELHDPDVTDLERPGQLGIEQLPPFTLCTLISFRSSA